MTATAVGFLISSASENILLIIRLFYPPFATPIRAGSAASKFAGQAVHKRLASEPAYRESRWQDALKDAFINADADLKAGVWSREQAA
jgi:hypothetical protein